MYCSKIEFNYHVLYWNHFINTSSSNETIQDTVKQWGVLKTCVALQAHALSSR